MLAKGIDRLIVLLFHVLRRMLLVLPPGPLLAAAGSLGCLIGRRQNRERGICAAQFELVRAHAVQHPPPLLQAEENRLLKVDSAEALTDEVFSHTGRAIVEAFIIPKLVRKTDPGEPLVRPPDMVHVDSSGQEQVIEVLREGSGAVALSGHIGCIELLAAYYVQCGVPLSVIGRLPNYPILAGLLAELRRVYGVETIWRNDPASSRKFREAMRKRRFIAALIDQDTRLENLYSPFFGIWAASPIMPIKLAVKKNLPVFSSFIVRTAPLRHHICTEPIPYDAEDPGAPQTILDTFNARLEELICRYPEQWIWWHRRWRRRPDIDYATNPRKLRSTGEYLEWLESEAGQRVRQ